MVNVPVFKRFRRIIFLVQYKVRKYIKEFLKFFILFILMVTGALVTRQYTHRDYLSDNSYDRSALYMKIVGAIKKSTVGDVSNMKIDWHNYTKIKMDAKRIGPGERGEPADASNISSQLVERLYKENGYNAALSDVISLHRSVRDTRPPDCSRIKYRKRLPNVSVIIPFHEEHFSVLLRTVWSLIERTPEHLLKEIILVDDCSTKEALKEHLDRYIHKYLPKVRLLRLKPRRGLIVTRLEGAKIAKGEVLLFLDSHCEANVNWLPPLLDLIAEDYRTCTCPFVDAIDEDTFEYKGLDGARGGFDWHLQWKVFFKLNRYHTDSTEWFENPVMPGGLFAISTKFFWELGGYDEGLYIWGGEQFELSFKIWQCGGRILDVPCSRVAHLYRKFHVFKMPENNKDYACTNLRRVAEVWMDEYKEQFYRRQPECAKIPYGDITKQLAVRKSLQCKPFKWFIEEVAYDVTIRHPLIDPPEIAKGEIRNIGSPNICIETFSKIALSNCSHENWAQTLQITWRGELKYESSYDCWEATQPTDGRGHINLVPCHTSTGNQLWLYDEHKMTLTNGQFNLCLDMDPQTLTLFLSTCEEGSKSQQWEIKHFNKTQQDKIPAYVKSLRMDGKR